MNADDADLERFPKDQHRAAKPQPNQPRRHGSTENFGEGKISRRNAAAINFFAPWHESDSLVIRRARRTTKKFKHLGTSLKHWRNSNGNQHTSSRPLDFARQASATVYT